MDIIIRLATADDIPALNALVSVAARELSAGFYRPEQITSALQYVFHLDVQLIADETYFVAEAAGQIVGAGGWSRRAALYRGDTAGVNDGGLLDPARDAAKIRAFYVNPRWSRRGIGRRLLQSCEAAASAAGFVRLELVATLTGAPLYTACGFTALRSFDVQLPDGVTLPCIHMAKALRPVPPIQPVERVRTQWTTNSL